MSLRGAALVPGAWTAGVALVVAVRHRWGTGATPRATRWPG
ncbi:hypothetical protein AB0J72_53440 [Dactylosporangium sp. NPDC049742]